MTGIAFALAAVILGGLAWDFGRRTLALRSSHRDELAKRIDDLTSRLDVQDERIRDLKNQYTLTRR